MTTDARCSEPSCSRPVACRGLCAMHYKRMLKHGTTRVTRVVRATKSVCVVAGCDEFDAGNHGNCSMHWKRVKRHGHTGVLSPGRAGAPERQSEAAYDRAHRQLRTRLGSASAHACVTCGSPAKHWSYDHAADDEQWSNRGPYSFQQEHYEPKCISCHVRFDADRARLRRAAA